MRLSSYCNRPPFWYLRKVVSEVHLPRSFTSSMVLAPLHTSSLAPPCRREWRSNSSRPRPKAWRASRKREFRLP